VDARAVSLLLRSRANVHAIGDSVKDDVTGVGRLEILDLMCMMSFKYFDGCEAIKKTVVRMLLKKNVA